MSLFFIDIRDGVIIEYPLFVLPFAIWYCYMGLKRHVCIWDVILDVTYDVNNKYKWFPHTQNTLNTHKKGIGALHGLQ